MAGRRCLSRGCEVSGVGRGWVGMEGTHHTTMIIHRRAPVSSLAVCSRRFASCGCHVTDGDVATARGCSALGAGDVACRHC